MRSRGLPFVLLLALPKSVREIADKNFQLLKSDPKHPSLHFKRIGTVWSVRVGKQHRALGHDVAGGVQWFWIGSLQTTIKSSASNAFERAGSHVAVDAITSLSNNRALH
jgi:hypothetical protein